MAIKNLDQLNYVLDKDSPVMTEFRDLWNYAKAYGFDDWLAFDASILRDPVDYTGIVFDAVVKSLVRYPFFYCPLSSRENSENLKKFK
jgi:histidyl-tRNA synthetase